MSQNRPLSDLESFLKTGRVQFRGPGKHTPRPSPSRRLQWRRRLHPRRSRLQELGRPLSAGTWAAEVRPQAEAGAPSPGLPQAAAGCLEPSVGRSTATTRNGARQGQDPVAGKSASPAKRNRPRSRNPLPIRKIDRDTYEAFVEASRLAKTEEEHVDLICQFISSTRSGQYIKKAVLSSIASHVRKWDITVHDFRGFSENEFQVFMDGDKISEDGRTLAKPGSNRFSVIEASRPQGSSIPCLPGEVPPEVLRPPRPRGLPGHASRRESVVGPAGGAPHDVGNGRGGAASTAPGASRTPAP